MKGSLAFHQGVYENDCSSAPVTAITLWFWKLWKGAGVGNGIQPLDQYEDNTGGAHTEGA